MNGTTVNSLVNGIVTSANNNEEKSNLAKINMGLDRLAGKIPADNRPSQHSALYNHEQNHNHACSCVENPVQRNLNVKDFTIGGWCEACKYWWNSISQVPAYIAQICPGLDIRGYSITLEDYLTPENPQPNAYLFAITLNGPTGQFIAKSAVNVYSPNFDPSYVLMAIAEFVVEKIKWFRGEPIEGMVSATQEMNGGGVTVQQQSSAVENVPTPTTVEQNTVLQQPKQEFVMNTNVAAAAPLPKTIYESSKIVDNGAGFSEPVVNDPIEEFIESTGCPIHLHDEAYDIIKNVKKSGKDVVKEYFNKRTGVTKFSGVRINDDMEPCEEYSEINNREVYRIYESDGRCHEMFV